MGESSAWKELLLVKDCLFGQVQQVDAACFVSRQQVVVAVAAGRKSGDVVRIEGVLRVVFPEGALVVLILTLLLYFEQPQAQLVENGL